jgi:hypothetical protein
VYVISKTRQETVSK